MNPEVSEVSDTRDDVEQNVDIRPHIFDPVMKKHLLVDGGSMVSAFPPDPGDQPVKNHFLKAANGTRMACFGYKNIDVKIGRKNFNYQKFLSVMCK